MKEKDKIVNKFSNEVDRLEKHLKYRTLYNYRNLVIKCLIKSGIFLDYAFPFILSTLVILYCKMDGNLPFYMDDIKEYVNFETIDTSSGVHMENTSLDSFDYDYDSIEYSTGWVINDFSLYERVVTSYRISDEIDLSSVDNILAMSKENIDKMLVTTNIKTICKNKLDDEDKIYDEDTVIVVRHFKSDEDFVQRKETFSENALNSTVFILVVLLLSASLGVMKEIFIKTYFRDKLSKCEPLFKTISKKEMEDVKGMLDIKKESLLMLGGQMDDSINDEYLYELRRK